MQEPEAQLTSTNPVQPPELRVNNRGYGVELTVGYDLVFVGPSHFYKCGPSAEECKRQIAEELKPVIIRTRQRLEALEASLRSLAGEVPNG